MVSTSGQTVVATQANGNRTRWTGRVATFGQMVAGMKGPTLKIRNMDLVFIPGLTNDSTKACGTMVSNMAKENTFYRMVQAAEASGNMAFEINGFLRTTNMV